MLFLFVCFLFWIFGFFVLGEDCFWFLWEDCFDFFVILIFLNWFKKKILHFHIYMFVLSLFCQSQKRQPRRKELINIFDQKPADRITKVYLVLSGWGTSRVGQLCSSVFFWPETLTGCGWNPHAAR